MDCPNAESNGGMSTEDILLICTALVLVTAGAFFGAAAGVQRVARAADFLGISGASAPPPVAATESAPVTVAGSAAERASQSSSAAAEDPNGVASSSEAPPAAFMCCITSELFTDPVVVVGDGHSYERAAIERWSVRGPKRGAHHLERPSCPS